MKLISHYCPELMMTDFTASEIKERMGDLVWRGHATLLHPPRVTFILSVMLPAAAPAESSMA